MKFFKSLLAVIGAMFLFSCSNTEETGKGAVAVNLPQASTRAIVTQNSGFSIDENGTFTVSLLTPLGFTIDTQKGKAGGSIAFTQVEQGTYVVRCVYSIGDSIYAQNEKTAAVTPGQITVVEIPLIANTLSEVKKLSMSYSGTTSFDSIESLITYLPSLTDNVEIEFEFKNGYRESLKGREINSTGILSAGLSMDSSGTPFVSVSAKPGRLTYFVDVLFSYKANGEEKSELLTINVDCPVPAGPSEPVIPPKEDIEYVPYSAADWEELKTTIASVPAGEYAKINLTGTEYSIGLDGSISIAQNKNITLTVENEGEVYFRPENNGLDCMFDVSGSLSVNATDGFIFFDGTNGSGGILTLSGSAIICEAGSNLVIDGNVEFSKLVSVSSGASINIKETASCTISGGVSFADGGVSTEKVGHGGAIYNLGTLSIDGKNDMVSFKNNYSGGNGGAIYNMGAMTINRAQFISNGFDNVTRKTNYGGAIKSDGTEDVKISNCLFKKNGANYDGGAANFTSGKVTLENISVGGDSDVNIIPNQSRIGRDFFIDKADVMIKGKLNSTLADTGTVEIGSSKMILYNGSEDYTNPEVTKIFGISDNMTTNAIISVYFQIDNNILQEKIKNQPVSIIKPETIIIDELYGYFFAYPVSAINDSLGSCFVTQNGYISE